MDESVLNGIEKVLLEDSCYPDFDRKPYDVRKRELIEWYQKYHEVHTCYNLWGMDRVCSQSNDDWLDRGVFRKQRHDVNAAFFPEGSRFPYDYTLLMRDKLAFEMFMQNVLGDSKQYCFSDAYLIGRQFYEHSITGGCKPTTIECLLERFDGEKMVFKRTFGFSGDGVRIVRFSGGFIIEKEKTIPAEEFLESTAGVNSCWLIQKYLQQHPILEHLNKTSVNTMRILTFHLGQSVEVGNATLRIGKEGAEIDNADNGGMMMGIDENGRLDAYELSFLEKTRRVSPFSGVQLPFFREAQELVRYVHCFLPGLFSIGWDIVFTEDGPMILEGNDGWDPNLSQAPSGVPLRETWNRCLAIRNLVLQGTKTL